MDFCWYTSGWKAALSSGQGTGDEARNITLQQYRWLMEGLSIEQPKAHRPIKGLEII